ncbi:MAG: hypothetical protein R3Y39_04670 [Rikenellaceae bacterium]
MREFIRERRLWIVIAMIALLPLYGCDDDSEDNDDQRDDIESFLASYHDPKLIPQDEISSSIEDEPSFYFEFGTYAYLYIDDYYNTSRDSKAQIVKGSQITITFRLYPFDGSTISDSDLPTYTNDPAYEYSYIEAGLNTTYWSFEPLELVIGQSKILDSIQEGLLMGCREGDSIEIYMTRNMGYGDDVIGVMEEDSAIAFFCTIDSVVN